MKKSFLIVFIFFSFSSFAQNNPLERKASFHFSNEPLEKVLADLKDVYAVEFSYSDDVLPLDAVISLSAKNVTLQWVLEYLESDFSITYKLLENRLILTIKQLSLFQVVRGRVKQQDTHEPIAAANVQILGVEPALASIGIQKVSARLFIRVEAGYQECHQLPESFRLLL